LTNKNLSGVKSSAGGSFELNKNLNLSNNKENISLISNSNTISSNNQAESGSISVTESHHHSQQGITIDNDSSILSDENDHLANQKEKTPMCLVNELARYNKIQHQYRLTYEQGPAHKKRFTVTLKLGEEEYTAEGLSIKKAQHAAAKEAITKTVYKHPPLKTNRQISRLTTKNNSGIYLFLNSPLPPNQYLIISLLKNRKHHPNCRIKCTSYETWRTNCLYSGTTST
jgi:hypothetical protein